MVRVEEAAKTKKGLLSIDNENIFSILRDSLYTEQDIVFRELIANGLDAISKRQLSTKTFTKDQAKITVRLDNEAHTLTFTDNGIGMTEKEVDRYINQIAFSGAQSFIKAQQTDDTKAEAEPETTTADNAIIGHFGVGFYSAFMYTDHVAIDTLSSTGGEPVFWDCHADMAYNMSTGHRTTPGSDVILYLNEDSPFFDKPQLILDAIKKYFIFATTPIYLDAVGFENQLVNTPEPIWELPEDQIDHQAMNEFYQDYFNDTRDPIFWLKFQSADIGVHGILFFRDTKHGTEDLDGTINIYNRGVYVGSNIPEIVPKYVNLQSGIIECDNLPLAVSRSSVKEDEQNQAMQMVNECLTQEVSIAFYKMFTEERPVYEERWPEINAFVKYGIMKDKTFSSVMAKRVIFQDIYSRYHTLDEYLETHDTVYYVSDQVEEAHYIALFKQFGLNALLFDHVIDQPLMYRYETLYPKNRFIRIDSNIDAIFKDEIDVAADPIAQNVSQKFTQVLAERLDAVTLKFTRLQEGNISCLLTNDEEARRRADMMEIYGMIDENDFREIERTTQRTLVINLDHPTIQYIANNDADNLTSTIAIKQLFDLALLSQQALDQANVEDFINRSEALIANMVQS